MQEVKLNVYGLTICWDGQHRGSATICSNLNEDAEGDSVYLQAVDAVESVVLAHFCAGIDVTSPAYLEGIEVACEKLGCNAVYSSTPTSGAYVID